MLLECRNDDAKKSHVEWCKALKALFVGLKGYVKAHHTTGPAWSPNGVDAASLASSAAPPAAPKPPPPPPPGTLR